MRPRQICYSNREAVEYYARRQAEYAAEHPEIHILGTWPLDGGGYCQCEGCRSPETVFKAVVEVAERVRAVRPGLTVEHLAYRPKTWEVPRTVTVPENVSVLFCPNDRESLARDWVEATGRARGTYSFEYRLGDNYNFMANVWLLPGFAVQVARNAEQIGYRGVVPLFLPIQNWWQSSFNSHFFAAACWDPELDVEAELENYYAQHYGEYAGDVEEVFRLILTELQNGHLEVAHNALGGSNGEPLAPEGTERTHRAYLAIRSILGRVMEDDPAPEVARRLERLALFAEHFDLYYRCYTRRSPADLDSLAEFSRQHYGSCSEMVIYPEYIRDRVSEYYR